MKKIEDIRLVEGSFMFVMMFLQFLIFSLVFLDLPIARQIILFF
jgi:hypothetical protein